MTEENNLKDGELAQEEEAVFQIPGEGEYTLEGLKEAYSGIYDQVTNRTNLLKGYIHQDLELFGIKFRLRTFRHKETESFASAFFRERLGDNPAKVDSYRLVVGLLSVDGDDKAVPAPTLDSLEEWLDSALVKQKVEYIGDWDSELVASLSLEQMKLEHLRQIFVSNELKKV